MEQTLDDYLAGRDTLVDWLLANGADYTAPEQPDAPLTRGRLAWMLWQAAGARRPSRPLLRSDALRLLCPRRGLVRPDRRSQRRAGGAFRASCAVTLEEAAQMLVRFVRQQGLTPGRRCALVPPSSASDPAPWASESVAQAWRWGLVAEGADPTGVLTRAQGEALLARLTS